MFNYSYIKIRLFISDRLSLKVVNMNAPTKDKFKCELCSKTYCYKKNLERHLLTHYEKKSCCHMCEASDTVELLLVSAAQEIFLCKICNKDYSYEQHLERHLRTHAKPDSLVCVKCGKPFSTQSLLNRHLLRMHFCCSRVPHCNHL